MVDVNEDALAVTMKIRRETRVAKEQSLSEAAASPSGELALPPPIPSAGPAASAPFGASAASVVVPAPTPVRPVDSETAFRRARLGVVAVLVLVLLLAWIAQRRARSPRMA